MTSWTFSTTPSRPRDPQVVLFAFSAGPLRGTASPGVQTVARAQDRGWFDGFRSGSMRAIATQDLGPSIAELDAADHVHVIQMQPRGVQDLAYLQQAWDLVRQAIAGGATVVLDAMALTFTPAAKVQPAGEAIDLRREVRLVYETDAALAGGAHAMHTRGMRKFGAPDLVALCTDDDVKLVGAALGELAEQVALGLDLKTPLHPLEVAPGVHWAVVEDEHRLGQVLQLNNVARVLVDGGGNDLMGAAKRAATPGD